MDSIQTFEQILQYGSRDTTYKFGLLLGVVDFIIENPLQVATNNFHFIPIFYLAKQFLAYYHPLIIDNIRQGPIRDQKASITLERYHEEYIKKANDSPSTSIPVHTSSTTHKLYASIEEEIIPIELRKLIFKIRKTILNQPLQYIRNLKGEKTSFFGLLAKNTDYSYPFEDHRKNGLGLKWREFKSFNNWEAIEKHENCHLFLSHQAYVEISGMRFWLRDVLIKRWAQECIERFDCQDPTILSKFDLWKKPPERNSALMQKYRKIYEKIGLIRCIYCDMDLKEQITHLDHFLPWSHLPINKFWNLYPSCQSCNSKKKDRIPHVSEELVIKLKKHLMDCVQAAKEKKEIIILKDIQNLYNNSFNSPELTPDTNQMVEEIFDYFLSLRNELLSILPGKQFESSRSESTTNLSIANAQETK